MMCLQCKHVFENSSELCRFREANRINPSPYSTRLTNDPRLREGSRANSVGRAGEVKRRSEQFKSSSLKDVNQEDGFKVACMFVKALKEGRLFDASKIIAFEPSVVNKRVDAEGSLPLYWAAGSGNVVACNWLLQNGADVSLVNTITGSSALHAAADRGHLDIVLSLINRGIDLNKKTFNNHDTALHLAAYRGHQVICDLLLKQGADWSVVNKQGRTPLDEAKALKNRRIVDLFKVHIESQQSNSDSSDSSQMILKINENLDKKDLLLNEPIASTANSKSKTSDVNLSIEVSDEPCERTNVIEAINGKDYRSDDNLGGLVDLKHLDGSSLFGLNSPTDRLDPKQNTSTHPELNNRKYRFSEDWREPRIEASLLGERNQSDSFEILDIDIQKDAPRVRETTNKITTHCCQKQPTKPSLISPADKELLTKSSKIIDSYPNISENNFLQPKKAMHSYQIQSTKPLLISPADPEPLTKRYQFNESDPNSSENNYSMSNPQKSSPTLLKSNKVNNFSLEPFPTVLLSREMAPTQTQAISSISKASLVDEERCVCKRTRELSKNDSIILLSRETAPSQTKAISSISKASLADEERCVCSRMRELSRKDSKILLSREMASTQSRPLSEASLEDEGNCVCSRMQELLVRNDSNIPASIRRLMQEHVDNCSHAALPVSR